MATCTTETVVLPNPNLSTHSSLLFLKKVTGLAISNILYLRNLFDENDFTEREFDGLRIKVIKAPLVPKNSELRRSAQCVYQWIAGAFDALERKYLRTIVLEIRESSTGPLLESYSFRFTYNNGTDCTLEGSSPKGSQKGIVSSTVQGETRKEVQHLLRNILIMTSTMQNLPSNCITSMKIEYYDEVTPIDYEPPGFKPLNENLALFKEKLISIRCGKVETPHHGLVVTTKQPCEKEYKW